MSKAKYKHLSSDQIKDIVNLYTKDEYSTTEISKIFSVSVTVVRGILKRNNVVFRKQGNMRQEIKYQHDKLVSEKVIGRELSYEHRKNLSKARSESFDPVAFEANNKNNLDFNMSYVNFDIK